MKRNPDKVAAEINRRLREDLKEKGSFSRIHPMPQSGQDVADDLDARLVVLGIEHPCSKEGNAAETAAKSILEYKGNAPRIYRNTLVFLAADKTRLQDLDEAVRKFLAWESILAEKGESGLNLDPQQVKQAETQKSAADGTVQARMPETYQWLLVPFQKNPQAPIEWQTVRLSGQCALAVRASKKIVNDESLITSFAATLLKMELDKIPLWRGNHVSLRQLVEDFARYLYLPRLKDPSVLIGAVSAGLALLTWMKDSFAFADSFDEIDNRYRGFRAGQIVPLSDGDMNGLIVRPAVALRQLEAERAQSQPGGPAGPGKENKGEEGPARGDSPAEKAGQTPEPAKPKRFHGTVTLDATRVGRDAGRIAEEVIAHLSGLVGTTVTVTLEIEAEIPSGAPEHVVRTVTENSRTLKFTSQGFEKE